MTQDITLEQLLPIAPPRLQREEAETPRSTSTSRPRASCSTNFSPSTSKCTMFKAMLESVASEHGARMTAMDSASKNATEMIGKLTLIYNSARQAAITTELMEIISGAESIKG